ncbi:nicotinate-nucleotide--dimethylbenzimidazole phosphoribosyltransferase [Streptomyces sp. NPDC047000]|uniref:nicotinate-nucleotide--dimethylbenzimidazole phosphoribosyltransferase n=1 Tax=Streptomyces sp. NPDC047000 TaxID=3155474 RepID=UPI0033CC13CC
MTDTGQVPGDGQPESAGMVEQPGVPPLGYTYLSETTAEDEDLLLPGAQSAWGNEVAPPAPEPVVETVVEPLHEPGAHEAGGRDTGSVDLGAVRNAGPVPLVPSAGPRRPLHLGPPMPSTSASPVRSLADRGPAGAPARHRAPAAGTSPAGPEYLDASRTGTPPGAVPQGTVPWGAPAGGAHGTHAAPAPAAGGHAGPSVSAVPTVPSVPSAVSAAPVAPAAPAVPVPSVAPAVAAPAAPVVAGPVVAGIPVPEVAQAQAQAPAATPAPAMAEATVPVEDVRQADAGMHAEPGVPEPGVPDRDVTQSGEAVGPGTGPVPETVPGPPDGSGAAEGTGGRFQDPARPDGGHGAPLAEVTYDSGAQAAQGTVSGPAPAPVPSGDQGTGSVPMTPGPDPVPVGPDGMVSAGSLFVPEAVPAPVPVSGSGDVLPDAPVPQPADGAESGQVHEAAPVQQAPGEPAPAAGTTYLYETALPVAPGQDPEPVPVASAAVAETVEEEAPAAPESVPPAEAVQAAEAYAQAVPEAVPAAPEQQFAPSAGEAPGPVADPQLPAGDPAAQTAVADPQLAVASPDPDPAPGFAAVPAAGPAVPAERAVEPVTEPVAETPAGQDPEQPAAAGTPLPGGVPLEPRPDQPLGEFVPVEGIVPTTPHLAPTPPHPIVLPVDGPQIPEPTGAAAPEPATTAGPVPIVPAPRADADAVAVAHEDDAAVPAPGPQEPESADAQGAPAEAGEPAEPGVETQAGPGAPPVPEPETHRSTGPAAPAYDEAEREAVLKVMRERRDIRNGFRSDPIPHEVLLRVLEAAHTAPSVGHSQPWDFVVIRSAETRRSMHELAERQRDAYAKSLPKGRAKQFKELKIEAILDTPVNIVVTADPTRGGRHTLGRHTQPQMAPYSAALAVENLWLAARAEGLGVGWVSFFDEREMVRALGLPEHLEVIAYLCVGYVDEFPDEPELMQAGWSKRRPLSWVVHEETYGRRALPGEDPHDLLAETVAGIRPLDAKALGEAWERQKRMTKPAGALGMLEIISAQLSGLSRQCPPPIPEPAAVAVFAGDHGVHAQGVTPWPQEVTAQMVANFLGGGAVCNAFASQVGAEVCVIDVGVAAELPATPGLLPRKVRAGTSDMTTGPAMTREEAKLAIEVGIETARDLVAAGNKALLTGEMGIANTTASAALIAVYTGADATEVTGRGTGINDETLARKTEVVRRAIELHQPDPADPIGVLAAVGGFEHAALVGLLLGGASLRTPVILDGVSAGAAALVARAIAPEVLAACIAGHRSAEPGHVAALNKLGLRPLVDLDLRLGEGTGALLALPLVQSTARAMHEVATFDSAGVTEK